MKTLEDQDYRNAIKLKVKNDYGIELTKEDIDLCIIEQERKKVSIFHGQIYPNRRYRNIDGKSEFYISWELTIDGARAIAHRHGLCGIDKPVFLEDEHEDGIDGRLLPILVEVTVYRRGPRGERYPFTGSVRYDEFVQKTKDKKTGNWVPNRIWRVSPYNQLAKCAEAQALRKGFQEIGDDDPFLIEKGTHVDFELDDSATFEREENIVTEDASNESKSISETIKESEIAKAPEPQPEQKSLSSDEKTIDSQREKALPLLKAWCEKIGEKHSYKNAFEKLIGVNMSGTMTVHDYDVLISKLEEELNG